ncbi:hypothetical protein CDAR_36511 [Caerostris darwini]|uniref:Uncharacterized protein n=1 Tax=Caerostris darwini TaxID=1538125 RepID=A0AAV4M7W4_9ARAC|nr:hypothetical protein CDAR_36511 [Caerostris darwini]
MIGSGSSFLIAVPSGHDINLGELCDKTLVKRLTSPAPQTTPESDSVTLVAEVEEIKYLRLNERDVKFENTVLNVTLIGGTEKGTEVETLK